MAIARYLCKLQMNASQTFIIDQFLTKFRTEKLVKGRKANILALLFQRIADIS